MRPPTLVSPEPTTTLMLPPVPPVASPDETDTEPLLPLSALPLLRVTAPDDPALCALITVDAPLTALPPDETDEPVIISTDPPSALPVADILPACIKT